jgi:hypothetical protein
VKAKVSEYQVGRLFASHRRLFIELANELTLVDPEGKLAARVTDSRVLARTLVASMGSADVWSEAIGPVYDVAGVMRILGISKQAISKRENLLALTTGSGRVVYPAFQFVGAKAVDGISQIKVLLPNDLISPWDLASWLNAPESDLGGKKPIEFLRRGIVEPVLLSAASWSRNLSQ